MAIDRVVRSIIEEVLKDMGYDLLIVNFNIGKKSSTLQIFIDRIDQENVGISDCEKVSNVVSLMLDQADPIQQKYNLEVSSPGLDRPLVRLKDFYKFNGYEAKISTAMPINGRRNFSGILKGVEEESIKIFLGDVNKEVAIDFNQIQKAKLVLTDKLIKDFAPKKIYEDKFTDEEE